MIRSIVVAACAFGAAACGGLVEPTGGGSSSGASEHDPPIAPGKGTPSTPATPATPSTPPVSSVAWTSDALVQGCEDFTLWAPDAGGAVYLVIVASKAELGLVNVGDTATVDLAKKGDAPSTQVIVDTYDKVPRSVLYCADVGDDATYVRTSAYNGKVTFTVVPSEPGFMGTYAIGVTLENVVTPGYTVDRTFGPIDVGWTPP